MSARELKWFGRLRICSNGLALLIIIVCANSNITTLFNEILLACRCTMVESKLHKHCIRSRSVHLLILVGV